MNSAALSVWLSVAVLLRLPCAQCEVEQITWRENADIRDTIFHEDLVFSTSVSKSVLDCGRWCSRTDGCLSFTFTRHSSSQGTCRGHSSPMMTRSLGSPEPNTEGYQPIGRKVLQRPVAQVLQSPVAKSQWVGQACSHDQECSADNASCFHGQCLCIPGYYYSRKGNNCVLTCSPADLQPSFMQYPSGLLSGHVEHREPSGFSLYDCETLCIRDPECRAITYIRGSGMCMTHNVTARDVNGNAIHWFPNLRPQSYSQRTCA